MSVKSPAAYATPSETTIAVTAPPAFGFHGNTAPVVASIAREIVPRYPCRLVKLPPRNGFLSEGTAH
jgi:hypothetical protein